MKKITLLLVLAVSFVFAFTACEGPVGPQGPPGYNGRDGNSSMSVFNYNLRSYQWQHDGGGRWYYSLEMPEVTPDVVDYGAVLCYRENIINGVRTYEAMPITTLLEYNGEIFTNELWYTHYDGYVDFEWLDTHPTDPLPPDYDMYFKIVVIHPSDSYKVKNMDLNDYNAVAKALDLEDLEAEITHSKDFRLK